MKILLLLLVFTSTLWSQWVAQNSGTNLELIDAHFQSVNKGWICGARGIILRTTDGGSQWHQFRYDSNYTMTSITFINDNTGFASCTYMPIASNNINRILKTTDGGISWTLLFSEGYISYSMRISSVKFSNINTGFLTMQGSNGFESKGVLKFTTNGGTNWINRENLPSYMSYEKVIFTDQNSAYLLCRIWDDQQKDTGYVYHTTNLGANWTPVFKKGHSKIQNILYTNYIISLIGQKSQPSSSILIRSIDMGGSWDTLLSFSTPIFRCAYFLTNTVGWMAGVGGSLAYTDNGGINWSTQLQGGSYSLNYIQMFNSCTGWAIGSNGTILKTITCGITSLLQFGTEIPQQFSLSQNYPNPFNPTTNIKFDIAKSGFVKLTAFDVLGREIQTLVNEQLSPGSYNYDFDAAHLPSGVYYYKLESENFIETKKMVLIK
jgi:photosystem II stability/assembly factor-like uncharacterized protein